MTVWSPCTQARMVFLACPSPAFPTAVWNPVFPACPNLANSMESLTDCGSDDTTGADTCPTGTAFFFLLAFSHRTILARRISGRQLVGFLQQGYLLLVGHLRGLLYGGCLLQLLQLGFQRLLFGIFLRGFVETAERGVDVIVGGIGRGERTPVASAVTAGCTVIWIFRCGFDLHHRRFRLICLAVICHCREVLQRAHLLFLPVSHVSLLVGRNLVRLNTRPSRVGQLGVESGVPLLFLPVLLRRGENPPHAADEQQEHSGKYQVFPDFLPLLQFVCVITHCLTC